MNLTHQIKITSLICRWHTWTVSQKARSMSKANDSKWHECMWRFSWKWHTQEIHHRHDECMQCYLFARIKNGLSRRQSKSSLSSIFNQWLIDKTSEPVTGMMQGKIRTNPISRNFLMKVFCKERKFPRTWHAALRKILFWEIF